MSKNNRQQHQQGNQSNQQQLSQEASKDNTLQDPAKDNLDQGTPAQDTSPVDKPLDTSKLQDNTTADSILSIQDSPAMAMETPTLETPATVQEATATESAEPVVLHKPTENIEDYPSDAKLIENIEAIKQVSQEAFVGNPRQRSLARGTPLTPVVEEGSSVKDYFNSAVNKNDLTMQMLIENLTNLEKRLGPRTIAPMEETAKAMVGLHNTLVGVINNAKSSQEFTDQWNMVCQFFKEHEKGGLGLHRVYRAVAYWSKSQDQYMHFQALMNAIYVTNNLPKNVWAKNINYNALSKSPVTDVGRGRLMSYYL